MVRRRGPGYLVGFSRISFSSCTGPRWRRTRSPPRRRFGFETDERRKSTPCGNGRRATVFEPDPALPGGLYRRTLRGHLRSQATKRPDSGPTGGRLRSQTPKRPHPRPTRRSSTITNTQTTTATTNPGVICDHKRPNDQIQAPLGLRTAGIGEITGLPAFLLTPHAGGHSRIDADWS